MIVGFGILALITTTMAWYSYQLQKEIDDLQDRLDLAEQEADELYDLAESERKRADHFELIYQESEFDRLRKRA